MDASSRMTGISYALFRGFHDAAHLLLLLLLPATRTSGEGYAFGRWPVVRVEID